MAARNITTPVATPERAADVLGVSKARASKLIGWARTASENATERVRTNPVKTNGKVVFRKAASK